MVATPKNLLNRMRPVNQKLPNNEVLNGVPLKLLISKIWAKKSLKSCFRLKFANH